MKIIVTVMISCLGFLLANTQSYKANFRADMCMCLEEESLKRQLTENAFKSCLLETLPKYAEQIDAEIIEPDVNKKLHKGQIARKDLLLAMYIELIYTCDVYYKHLEFKRTSAKLIARENAKPTDLEKYNKMVALKPSAANYFLRAELQFSLGNIEATQTDIKKSLELHPKKENPKSTRHQLMLLASVYEEQKRYAEAIVLYDKIYFGDLDIKVAQLRALADKKAGGSMSGIPKKVKANIRMNSQTSNKEANGKDASGRRLNGQTKRDKIQSTQLKKKKDSSDLRKLFKIKNG